MKPSISRLHELFLYPDNGVLYRKPSRASDFANLRPVGCEDPAGYLNTSVDGHPIRVHEIVFAMTRAAWPNGEIDHANGIKGDNRPENLRDATRSQNQHNRGKQQNNVSGVKGVRWNKQRRKWQALIMVDRKVHHLGLYDDPEMAGYAYMSAALKHRGEFARAANA